jgi:hypothetical protein
MFPPVSARSSFRMAFPVFAAALALSTPAPARAQACPGTTLTAALLHPLGIAQSNLGNLIISETGTMAAHSGRLSIVDTAGMRRTLIDGLPSGINDVSEPSGPHGIVMRGRIAYLLIGIGDSVLAAPGIPGRNIPNPNVSSPIFSSVLAIHFSANVERSTRGFTLSEADQGTLAGGKRVILSNGGGDTIELELVADFPDYVPDPLPGNPQIVRGSNPFALALVANQLYVTDGGRNHLWQVDVPTGDVSVLAAFPPIVPNPVGGFGPVLEAVPTGITAADGALLVTLFRGAPFPAGTSSVVRVDPVTGAQSTFIGGLRTAIGIARRSDGYYVLQHSSGPGLFFAAPGVILRFASPSGSAETLANCLTRPTAFWLDEASGTIYVTEFDGRLVALGL